ncbi:glycoside hydrolase family 16 protein [Schizopora paradoxa]|uniref:Glycoside hydrolase family 16 protein n=1 Tax=Schizopora paradoxa TaxID=27342 RepID=A0A0H2RCL2_9AGAM|nr:glycoside hydrolase family 16 protein [Schizopora paradoxa]
MSVPRNLTLLVLCLCTLPLAALAGSRAQSPKFVSRSRVPRNNGGKTFTLTDKFNGQTFFDNFDFFNQTDPTHGSVNYLSKGDAQAAGLAYVQDDGTVIMKVDNTTQLSPGQFRNSIQSKNTYSSGLFIADIYSMPHGCSVWPAFWAVGGNWPEGGEIDIIENVHDATFNQMTLHTSAGCSLDNSTAAPSNMSGNYKRTEAFTSTILSTACQSSPTYNDGCAFQSTDTASYGHAFNMIAGGVYATLLSSEGVSIWNFPRTNIPSDILASQPNPSTWGTPAAFWNAQTCDTSEHFTNLQLVFDITLCGDWAGATYTSAGCPGTCAEAVADPTKFDYAHWAVNYVAVYQ